MVLVKFYHLVFTSFNKIPYSYRKVALGGTHRRIKLLFDTNCDMTRRLGYKKVQKVKNNEDNMEKGRCKIFYYRTPRNSYQADVNEHTHSL